MEALALDELDAELSNCSAEARTVFPALGDAVVTVMYAAVFLVALLGNGLVVFCVVSSPRMRTATNYMLLNLAVGDMLMTLLCVPFTFVSTLLLQYWPFGAGLCHLVSFAQAVSVLVSSYTLVAISVDRYLAVLRPLRARLTRREARWSMAGVWLGAVATALPIPYWSRLGQPEPWHRHCGRWVCQEVWPSAESRQRYGLALMALQYLAPSFVLLFTYTRIALVVWVKRTPGEAEGSRDRRFARAKRKMIKMMVVVVVGYTVCWLPLNALVVAWDTHSGLADWPGLPPLWFCSHWLAMSHSCLNPLIYYWMSGRFRASYRSALLRLPCVSSCLRHRLRHRRHRAGSAHSALTSSTCTTAHMASMASCPPRSRLLGKDCDRVVVGTML